MRTRQFGGFAFRNTDVLRDERALWYLGKTLLPVPAGAERVAEEASNGHSENGHSTAVDSNLLHAIESVVIEWSHQVQDVLKKDSSQGLLEGGSPLPRVEVDFWKSRYTNLQNIHEQVREEKRSLVLTLLTIVSVDLAKRSTGEENG